MSQLATATTSCIGICAMETLGNPSQGTVIGITSRGIFLKTLQNDILYLTNETCRGPLTINAVFPLERLDQVSPGDRLDYSPDQLVFPKTAFEIRLSGAQVWSTRQVGVSRPFAPRWEECFQAVIEIILSEPPETPLLPLLSSIAASRHEVEDPFHLLPILQGGGFTQNEFELTVPRFVGFGTGLTPSGDDLLMGLAYSLYLRSRDEDTDIRLKVLRTTPLLAKTNLISQNLIRAASAGEVDERIADAFSGILYGGKSPAEIAHLIRSWGNSSGCDSLVGLGIGFSAPVLQTSQHLEES